MASRYREITLSAIVLGILIGAVMNASIAYAGLKIGFTIGGSTIAAVLGFGVLRGLLRKGSILETNITQTVASAVNIPNSGIIFTVPVLFLLGYELGFNSPTFWLITLACTVGAILGCAFIIPVRKQMLDIDRLRFPTGTAVATILKSPGAGPKKSLVLLAGAVIAVLIYLPAGMPGITFRADLKELDQLVKTEKISPAVKQRTLEIDMWIKKDAIPKDVAKRGRLEKDRLKAKKIKPTQANHFAIAAYEVSIETDKVKRKKKWGDLKQGFWARKPLPGYSDVNWRFSEPSPAKVGDANDAERYKRERKNIDRDKKGEIGYGNPDLVLDDHTLHVGRLLGLPGYMLFAFAIAPFAFGAGYITGKPGLLVLAGGILAYHVLNPAMYWMGYMPANFEAYQAPDYGYGAFNRPLGIGMLLGGALMGVLFALPAIKAALKSIAGAAKSGGGSDELGLKVLLIAAAICFVLLLFASYAITNQEQVTPAGDGAMPAKPGLLSGLPTPLQSLAVAIFGMAWIWFAGIIIAQCTGMTDWSPISGMALITIIFIMFLIGTGNVLGAVLIGATLCVAVTCAADMMQDLKTGYLVGGKPIRQQAVELATTGLGPVIAMLTIVLLSMTYKFGSPDLPAPQAQALGAVIEGTQGGEMPYYLYSTGGMLAIVLGLGSFPGLGVLVGLSMYLPIVYILPYGVGCLVQMLVVRLKGRGWSEEWGVPFSAGLIVGEAVLAIVISAIVLMVQGMGL